MSNVSLRAGKRAIPLDAGTHVVGRRDRITGHVPQVDLYDLDSERSVSRRHAELDVAGDSVTIRDLGSTNGTFVNGQQLPPQVSAPLRDGDQLSFGGVELTLSTSDAAGVSTTTPAEPTPPAAVPAAEAPTEQPSHVITVCVNHPHIQAVALCVACAEPICRDCAHEVGDEGLLVCEADAQRLAGAAAGAGA